MSKEELLKARQDISNRINLLLLSDEFELSIDYLRYIHRYLFAGILKECGNFRDYNIRKKESILRGESVIYPDYHTIEQYLGYDITAENGSDYSLLSYSKKIKKVARFTSNIWNTHPFREGNTRTTCVFIEKYLRSLGYFVDNEIFRMNSGYFRDALVRSVYRNELLMVFEDFRALLLFFDKVLVDNSIVLDDDLLYIPELYQEDMSVR